MSLVFAGVCSHAPGITGRAHLADPALQGRLPRRVPRAWARQLRAAQPDALIVVAAEHFANFFMNNMPAYAIGMADHYEGPVHIACTPRRRPACATTSTPLGAGKGDALLLVDCVTSLGGIQVEIDGWGVDLAYSGTQKCLGVPPGLAPLTVSRPGPRAVRRASRSRGTSTST